MSYFLKTKILASIKSSNEASIVMREKFDIIDFKNPETGSLGELSHNIIKSCLNILSYNQKTSATIGDIRDIDKIKRKVINLSQINVDFIKIGFFFDSNQIYKLSYLKGLVCGNKKLIAVLFADRNLNLKIIEKIKKINFDGILIDTENKKNGNLRNYLNDNYLKTFINFAKRKKLSIGLAGSLGINDINPLLQLSPDYIGFRGALCSGFKNRTNICKNSINNVISEFRCRSI